MRKPIPHDIPNSQLFREEAYRLDDLSTDYAHRLAHWIEKHDSLLAELAKYRDAPVACAQYQDREGNWKPFINANHEHNTRASMDWPVRDLIVKPGEEK